MGVWLEGQSGGPAGSPEQAGGRGWESTSHLGTKAVPGAWFQPGLGPGPGVQGEVQRVPCPRCSTRRSSERAGLGRASWKGTMAGEHWRSGVGPPTYLRTFPKGARLGLEFTCPQRRAEGPRAPAAWHPAAQGRSLSRQPPVQGASVRVHILLRPRGKQPISGRRSRRHSSSILARGPDCMQSALNACRNELQGLFSTWSHRLSCNKRPPSTRTLPLSLPAGPALVSVGTAIPALLAPPARRPLAGEDSVCAAFFLPGCGAAGRDQNGQSLVALDKHWHLGCFKCRTCGKQLSRGVHQQVSGRDAHLRGRGRGLLRVSTLRSWPLSRHPKSARQAPLGQQDLACLSQSPRPAPPPPSLASLMQRRSFLFIEPRR